MWRGSALEPMLVADAVRTELLRPDTMQDIISAYMCVACLEKSWLSYLIRRFRIYLWPAYQGC